MNQFADSDTERIYRTGLSARLSKSVARKAHTRLHILLAARELRDVSVMGLIARWPRTPGRYGVHVMSKWYICFNWEDLVGPFKVGIERHKAYKC